ncbi:TIR domain-containing protein [Sinomonas susongensis]|uniref:TIR domain-containing protein n=1 Tax=Sinomonas susongensis TaxID=1324851 RepID=UPI001109521E|nr:TIR domain-containing protein [Sinomonas susongensis]
MKVFISWSQDSCEFAGALKKVMRQLFDTVETFFSPEIPAGEQWLNMIEEELTDTDFGIICVTRQNQLAQWLNYEAGALSRQVGDRRKRLGVLLLDFENTNDVAGPFKNFQMKMATPEGFKGLMKSVNELGPNIDLDVLDGRIAGAWPLLDEALTALRSSGPAPKVPVRKLDEKVDELLTLVRGFDKSLNAPVIAPFVVSPEEREQGREFISRLYKLMRGRDVHLSFRPLDESTNVLDVSLAVSAQDRRSIEGYYRAFFPDDTKRLVIMDTAWKDRFAVAAEQEPEESMLASEYSDL